MIQRLVEIGLPNLGETDDIFLYEATYSRLLTRYSKKYPDESISTYQCYGILLKLFNLFILTL